MTVGMPDFAMPSSEEIERTRAQADDDAREAAAREALARQGDSAVDDASVDDAGEVPFGVAASPRDRPVPQRRGGRFLTLARNPVIAFAAGALLVATGFLAVPQFTAIAERGSAAQMRDVFDAYVDAVNDGDVEAALALHVPDEDRGSLELLEAGVAPTSPATVVCDEPEVRGEGDSATASCDATVAGFGGPDMSSQVRLELVDGDWRIVLGLEGRAYMGAWLFAITTIAGESVEVQDDQDYWLLPGSYDVETTTSAAVVVEDFGGLVVAGSTGYLQMYAGPSELVLDEAEATVVDYVEACLVDDETAQSCGLERGDGPVELTAFAESGFQQTPYTIAVPETRTGAFRSPTIEVIVEFSEDWMTYELDVTGSTNEFG